MAVRGILGTRVDGDVHQGVRCPTPRDRRFTQRRDEHFEATVEHLQRLIEQDKGHLGDREPEPDELDGLIRSGRQGRSRRQELVGKRRNLEQRLEERRDSLDKRRSRPEELRGELQSTDDEIAEHEARTTDDEVAAELESTRADL